MYLSMSTSTTNGTKTIQSQQELRNIFSYQKAQLKCIKNSSHVNNQIRYGEAAMNAKSGARTYMDANLGVSRR